MRDNSYDTWGACTPGEAEAMAAGMWEADQEWIREQEWRQMLAAMDDAIDDMAEEGRR